MTDSLGILGGRVCGSNGFHCADLLIHGEQVVAVGEGVADAADRVVDAAGAWVLPGAVDSHVHFNEPGRTDWEGFQTGSLALAAGGGTCFIDMPLNAAPPTVNRDAFELKRRAGEAGSCLDFALWGGLIPGNTADMPHLAACGVVGFKAFMLSSGMDDFPGVDRATLREGMRVAASLDLPVAVHAEDADVILEATRLVLASGRADARAFLESRPVEAETTAVHTAIDLALETGCSLHVVHASCPEVLELIRQGKASGADLTVEVCYHHAVLNDSSLQTHGVIAKCAPPLRDEVCRQAMFDAIFTGGVDGIGSDHSPAPPELKVGRNFFSAWGGIMGCQHGLLILCQLALAAGGEDALHRVWSLASNAPARRWGLGHQKGALEPGMDADVVLLRPAPPRTIDTQDLLYRHRTSPYCGMTLGLAIDAVFRRGKLLNPHRPGLPAGSAKFLKRL